MNSFPIPELAKRYTQYDMIQLHTDLPEFPASRTRLLCAFLNEPGQKDANGELYALAASLVQMGIDTHEMVSVSNDAKEKKSVRSRQLKVLAGDYFSSGFYHLLSQSGQIDMVKQLSAAICEVNRLKMTFYMRMKQLKLTAEDYISQMVKIRTQLFVHFDQLMKGVQHRLWPEILEGVAQCEVLAGEISHCGDPVRFHGSWGFWHIMQNGSREEKRELESAAAQDQTKLNAMIQKYNVKGQLHAMLEEQVRSVFEKAGQLGSDGLMQELQHIGEPFLRLVRQPQVLEER
jgi:heptaprenyl diphosphate synthase